MKAITTKYLGPTNFRGSRIKAFDLDNNSVTLFYHHAWDSQENHRRAAETLKAKMGWSGNLVCGCIKNGMVWVFVD